MECTCDKANEISACGKLYDALRLKGTVITADTMMSQKEFAGKVAKKNGYVLAVKGKQPALERDMKDFFNCRGGETRERSRRSTKDTEDWRCGFTRLTQASDVSPTKNVEGAGCVTPIKTGKETKENRRFITTLTDVKKFSEAVRSYWTIENNLHWSLDVTFHDGKCPVFDRNIADFRANILFSC